VIPIAVGYNLAMQIIPAPFCALALAFVALGMTLNAEDPATRKKTTAEAPKARPIAKSISPATVSSTALSEMIASNLTLAPGADQFVYAKTDFTGADDIRIGFYADASQDLSKTKYVTWWAIPNNASYNAADYWDGTSFAYLNSGSFQVSTFGNQFALEIKNTGTNPITFTQITLWANAH
jgi:hypothetical protein